MARQANFDLLRSPRGVRQGLADVFGFEVGIVAENLVPSAAAMRPTTSQPSRHAPNARLSAHYAGITSDAHQFRHVRRPSQVDTSIVNYHRRSAKRAALTQSRGTLAVNDVLTQDTTQCAGEVPRAGRRESGGSEVIAVRSLRAS